MARPDHSAVHVCVWNNCSVSTYTRNGNFTSPTICSKKQKNNEQWLQPAGQSKFKVLALFLSGCSCNSEYGSVKSSTERNKEESHCCCHSGPLSLRFVINERWRLQIPCCISLNFHCRYLNVGKHAHTHTDTQTPTHASTAPTST